MPPSVGGPVGTVIVRPGWRLGVTGRWRSGCRRRPGRLFSRGSGTTARCCFPARVVVVIVIVPALPVGGGFRDVVVVVVRGKFRGGVLGGVRRTRRRGGRATFSGSGG